MSDQSSALIDSVPDHVFGTGMLNQAVRAKKEHKKSLANTNAEIKGKATAKESPADTGKLNTYLESAKNPSTIKKLTPEESAASKAKARARVKQKVEAAKAKERAKQAQKKTQ